MLLKSEYKCLRRVMHGKKSDLSVLSDREYVTEWNLEPDLNKKPSPYIPKVTPAGKRAMEEYRQAKQDKHITWWLSCAALLISLASLIVSICE